MSAQLHQLTPWIQELVDNWVITPLEATLFEDEWLTVPPDQERNLPERFWSMASRMHLYESPSPSNHLH